MRRVDRKIHVVVAVDDDDESRIRSVCRILHARCKWVNYADSDCDSPIFRLKSPHWAVGRVCDDNFFSWICSLFLLLFFVEHVSANSVYVQTGANGDRSIQTASQSVGSSLHRYTFGHRSLRSEEESGSRQANKLAVIISNLQYRLWKVFSGGGSSRVHYRTEIRQRK